MADRTSLALSGVMVALATPLDGHGRLDPDGLGRLVERVAAGGVDGISPTGSTGEGARLSPEARVELTAQVRTLAPADMPIISGVPLSALDGGYAELDALASAGATAALVAPPSYFPLADDAVQRLYERLAERTPIPLVLYNIPVYTKVRIDPQIVGRLATHPQIVGIKDSGRDMEYLSQVLAETASAEFSVLTGTDSLLVPSLVLGAAGTIAASVNLVPELVVGIYRSFTAGDLPAALDCQQRLARVVDACRVGEFPAGWKAALEIVGVCGCAPAFPAGPLSPNLRDQLAARLAAEGVTR
jgi:4-hydroxy-tetrahydrodipicolinate synthase